MTSKRRLLEGSEAIAEAMVAAGCRFFAGYPMTPFTEVLEHMGRKLPEVGGVCMNAESEIEAVGMAWGAAATGARAATGSTGQGLSLMQETLSEITLARLPLVVLNMARAQGDYFQATRGGGHGDYRHIVLAPADIPEAVELVQLAFHLADTWRNPVLVFGDYYLAHTSQSVEISVRDHGPVPSRDWALDGSSGGSGRAKLVSPLGEVKQRDDVGYDLADHYQRAAAAVTAMSQGVTPLYETLGLDDPTPTPPPDAVGAPDGNAIPADAGGRDAETIGVGVGADGTTGLEGAGEADTEIRADPGGPRTGAGTPVGPGAIGAGVGGEDGGRDLDLVVVAFGTPSRYVKAVVRELRGEGARVGFLRPITLYPFPTAAVAAAARRARAVAVYENNQGQMIDDVRLAVLGDCPVHFIGGLSLDSSGFGIAPDLDVPVLRRRMEDVLAGAGRPDTTRGAA